MIKGFKDFLMRGNIIDLAVAVVIGTAFTALVTKFTESIIQPLISRIGASGTSSYSLLKFGIGGGQAIDLNVFVSAVINFVIIAAVVYFLIVLPYNTLRKRGEVEPEEVESPAEVELLTEIRDLLAAQPNGAASAADEKPAGKTSAPGQAGG
jgi:large conductance mechanosensitive channel